MPSFDFSTVVEEATWLVENIIPMGHLCVNLAQAGVGKSLLAESLAVHVVCGVPFAGFPTIEGDVLLVDQDTPQNTLNKRLVQTFSALGVSKKHELIVESMHGYYMHDNTLLTLMRDYSGVRLIIVDSMHSVCGRLNPNYTSDMSYLAKIKEFCLNGQNTIIFNHHISQKMVLTVDDLMLGETSHLAMGNSAIIQQADTYYIIGAEAEEGKTTRIYIRPVSKRISIPTKPIILHVFPTEFGEKMEYEGLYEPELELAEQDVLMLFREQTRERTVRETYDDMGHKHGEKQIRSGLASLECKGLLFMSRHKANLFKYRLP